MIFNTLPLDNLGDILGTYDSKNKKQNNFLNWEYHIKFSGLMFCCLIERKKNEWKKEKERRNKRIEWKKYYFIFIIKYKVWKNYNL